MGEKAIEVENLTKVYPGGVEAVKGISFSVEKGEIFGFLGPNGAGKTTTLKILCTLLKPTSGRAAIEHADVVERPMEVRERIGVVFQEPALDDKLTGRENLAYHAMLYGLERGVRERRMREVLALVGLEEAADRLVAEYSGGMRRKLEMARAVMHAPRVLFLDEPTLGLDAQTRRRLWEHIAYINKAHATTHFLTTHYIEEAEALCERVAIIDRGAIKIIDSPENIKRLHGKERVKLVFETPGDKERVKALLGESSSLRILMEREKAFEVEFPGQKADINGIIALLSQAGVKVRELSLRSPSLEDVYVELTGGQ
ncbi:MAG: ATP-binding cassette domain-containing protein [Gammaproteobacteria bacterium]|nr:MAG: ATP-binding cassette domain-containing protein [Gammaproteobacteria bacterium]